MIQPIWYRLYRSIYKIIGIWKMQKFKCQNSVHSLQTSCIEQCIRICAGKLILNIFYLTLTVKLSERVLKENARRWGNSSSLFNEKFRIFLKNDFSMKSSLVMKYCSTLRNEKKQWNYFRSIMNIQRRVSMQNAWIFSFT